VQVGLLLEQCLAPVPGGTGRYSRELALALAAAAPDGSSVQGVTAFHRSPLTVPGISVDRLPLPRRALVAAWERGLGPAVPGDLVHAPTPLHPARRTTPLVVTVHDAVPWTHPQTLTPRGVGWHRAMVGRAAQTADLVVVPTQAVADELTRHLPLRDVLVVGEGVSADLALPADAEERALALQLPERYLLTVSTLEPRKGLRELVAALQEVPGIPLLCVGQSGWGDTAGLAERADVRLMGRVPDADLAVLLHRATALVVPSLSEGFGLPLLEGMAAGTPVLTSDAPALVEVGGGAALAVPLADLVDGLRQITGDQALQARLRREGPLQAANYSWERAAQQLWHAYAQLHERDT
jgi:glycosyltransferase involved in cell wall biosynthesis